MALNKGFKEYLALRKEAAKEQGVAVQQLVPHPTRLTQAASTSKQICNV